METTVGEIALLKDSLRLRAKSSFIDCSFDKSRKKRMCVRGLRLEFGMELDGDEPRVIFHLDDFDQRVIGAGACNAHAVSIKLLSVGVVEFVAVSMPLGNDFLLIGIADFRVVF